MPKNCYLCISEFYLILFNIEPPSFLICLPKISKLLFASCFFTSLFNLLSKEGIRKPKFMQDSQGESFLKQLIVEYLIGNMAHIFLICQDPAHRRNSSCFRRGEIMSSRISSCLLIAKPISVLQTHALVRMQEFVHPCILLSCSYLGQNLLGARCNFISLRPTTIPFQRSPQ